MMKNHKKPNILMIAPVCYPPANPEAFVNAKLALAMQEAGWHVDIVTESFPGYQWYPFQQEAWGSLAESVHSISALPRTPKNTLLCALRSGVVMGGIFWAVPAFDCVKELVRQTRYDVILSRAVPESAHLPAMMLHRRSGIPWIANWNDPQPWDKHPPPWGKGPQAKMRLIEIPYYKKIVKHCPWHTFPCERLRDYMVSYLPDISERTSVIPHIALDSHCKSAVPHRGFSLCYAGSLRSHRNPEVLLEGLRRVTLRRSDLHECEIKFFVDRPDSIIQFSKEKGIENLVKIEKTQPYEKIINLLPAADVLIIIEAPFDQGVFLPSKFVDYVQTGRPILALSPVHGTLNDILSTHGGGLAVDCQDPEAVANALEELYSHWIEGTLDESYGSRHLLPLFSQQTVLNHYLELIERLSAANN